MTPADIDAIEDIVWQIVGRPAWNATLGYGSFVTMEFGERVEQRGHPHGEWHLWIYMCSWQLVMYGKQVADWEDDRDALRQVIPLLEGRTLESVVIDPDLITTELQFSDDASMILTPWDDPDNDAELWKLFVPDGRVLCLYPDGRWSFRPGDQLPERG